jgi:SAM-dependent methyltransferase
MKSRPTVDYVNRNEYRRNTTVGIIKSREGNWIDRCERLIINEIGDEFRAQPILDIGVGAGRTTWLLRLLSAEYIAVDWSPEMVETCRREHPGLDVREADARNLSAFDPDSFNLVFFSFNGIDLLSHEDRLRVTDEIYRILKPGGLFLYSTSNRNGKLYDIRPWNVVDNVGPHYVVRFLLRFPSSISRYWRSYRNWWQKRQYAEDHGAWAICTSCAYEFGCVLHWTRPSTERDALISAGFTHCEFRNQNGIPITDDLTTCSYFYVMARKGISNG